MLSKFYWMQNSIFFFPCACCNENPKCCFLRTGNRASPEVSVFKGKMSSPSWVLGATVGAIMWYRRGSQPVPVHTLSLSRDHFIVIWNVHRSWAPLWGQATSLLSHFWLSSSRSTVLCAHAKGRTCLSSWGAAKFQKVPLLASCLLHWEPALMT